MPTVITHLAPTLFRRPPAILFSPDPRLGVLHLLGEVTTLLVQLGDLVRKLLDYVSTRVQSMEHLLFID